MGIGEADYHHCLVELCLFPPSSPRFLWENHPFSTKQQGGSSPLTFSWSLAQGPTLKHYHGAGGGVRAREIRDVHMGSSEA